MGSRLSKVILIQQRYESSFFKISNLIYFFCNQWRELRFVGQVPALTVELGIT